MLKLTLFEIYIRSLSQHSLNVIQQPLLLQESTHIPRNPNSTFLSSMAKLYQPYIYTLMIAWSTCKCHRTGIVFHSYSYHTDRKLTDRRKAVSVFCWCLMFSYYTRYLIIMI